MLWGQMKWDVQIVSACVGLSHQQSVITGECGNLQEVQYLEEKCIEHANVWIAYLNVPL